MATEFLLVDGYNIIFAWPELRKLSEDSLDAARAKLADTLCNYQGFKKNEIILVFDGYKSKGNQGSVLHYNNIDIVYTKEAQTADQFIELVSAQMARDFQIRVASSDALEQMIILARGAARMSARELWKEVKDVEESIRKTYEEKRPKTKIGLFDNVTGDLAKLLEDARLGKVDMGAGEEEPHKDTKPAPGPGAPGKKHPQGKGKKGRGGKRR